MNIRKLIAGVVCLAAASGFLTGCGSASSTADKEEKVTVWAWDETFNIKAVNEAKKVYENEETEIEVVTMSQDDIVQKLNTALASGNTEGLPNIVLIEDYRIQGYLTSYPDAFANLSAIVKEDHFAPYKFAVNKVEIKYTVFLSRNSKLLSYGSDGRSRLYRRGYGESEVGRVYSSSARCQRKDGKENR